MSKVQNGQVTDAIIAGETLRVAYNEIEGVHLVAARVNIPINAEVQIAGDRFLVRKERISGAKGVRLYVVEAAG